MMLWVGLIPVLFGAVLLAAGSPESSTVMDALAKADTLYRASDYDAALQLIEATLSAAGRTLPQPLPNGVYSGEDALPSGSNPSPGIFQLESLAGRTLIRLRRYDRAEAVLLRVLTEVEALSGPESAETADILTSLGDCRTRMGNFSGARTDLERALAIREKVFDSQHLDVASSANRLGMLLHRSGDLTGAEPLYRQALAIYRAQPGDPVSGMGNCLNNLANLHQDLGDFLQAVELNNQALEIFKATYGPDHLRVSGSLLNLGNLWIDLGEPQKALERFERALEIRNARLGKDNPAQAEILNSMATIHEEAGQLGPARELYSQALLFWEEMLGPDHPYVHIATFNLGGLTAKTGDTVEARRLILKAMDGWASALGPNHPHVADGHHRLALLERREGRTSEALTRACRAAAIRLQRSQEDFHILSARQMQGYLAAEHDAFGLVMTLLTEASPDLRSKWLPRALDLELLRRGRMTEALSNRQLAVLLSDEPQLQALLHQYRQTREKLARSYLEPPSESDPDYRRTLQKLAGEKEDLERELGRRSQRFDRERRTATASLEEVRRNLPEQTVLVEFIRYRHIAPEPPSGAGNDDQTGEDQLRDTAIILPSGGDRVRLVPLGDAGDLDRLLTSLHESVGPDGPRGPGEARHYRQLSARLSTAVWQPLAAVIGSPRLVLVVPDGPLHLINFAGLPRPEGGFLIESGWRFHHLQTPRDVVHFGSAEGRSATPGEGILVLGEVDYGSPADETTAGDVWAALPETAAEIEDVTSCFTGEKISVLRGASANEKSFKARAPGHAFLHLATHGFFHGPEATDSVDGLTALEQANPLLLSGIVLAGANRPTRGEDRSVDDGILTAEEVASLDLRSVRCAVLSACRTGRGYIRAGEGVMGLRLAFRLAGAATILASLTRVDDEDSRAWMGHYYQALLSGEPLVEAVHLASRHRLEEIRTRGGSDAYSARWTPFLSAGDWH